MWVWLGFILLVLICLSIDLFIFNREDHAISVREAGWQTAIWVGVALLFSGVVYWVFSADLVENITQLTPTEAFLDYITGYVVELSLSVDNLFVIAVIFSSFKIPEEFRHRVLFWGIIGAMVFRALMIWIGVAMIQQFDWIMYVFGAFLLYTAFTMVKDEDQFNPQETWIYRQIKKIIPLTDEIKNHDFFVKIDGKRFATPLFVTLIVVEVSDVMFAVDSIPAILAITQDEFIAFSSNIMAIIGLRSMFFLVVGILEKFRFINYSLAVILGFVGLKMIMDKYLEISSGLSLLIIATALIGGILASILIKKDESQTGD